MKKFVCVLLLCLLVLSVTACSNTVSFESADAMMAHLEGMWMIDSVQSKKEYYIFQDGTIYAASDDYYQSAVQHALDEIATNGKKESFPYQTFDVVSERLYVEDIGNVENYVTLEANKGTIILHEGKDYEKRIEISQDGILIKNKGEKNGLALIKIADAPDFKTDHFRELFQAVRDEWTVPISAFLPANTEYLANLLQIHPVINNYILVHESEDTSIYTADGQMESSNGTLMLAGDQLLFSYGKNYKDQTLFLVYYKPGDTPTLMISDRYKTDLGKLLLYTIPVLEQIPGAYDVSEILELYEQQSTVSGGARSLNTTIEGITYNISRTTDNATTIIMLTVPEKMLVPEKEGSSQTETESTTPSETEPQAAGLFGKLDYDTVWTADYTITPWEYTLYFAFEENGTCYFALGDSTAVMSAGSGTYTAGEDNSLDLKLTIDGIPGQYAYQFTPETNTLTVTSREGIVGDRGQEHILKEHPDPSYLERLKGWAKASTSADSGEDWS